MPAKGKTRLTDAQRYKIAQGKVIGKRRAEIAAEAGVAESTVSNQLADPRTATLILRLKHRDSEQIERCWKKGLDGLEEDLTARDRSVAAVARGQLFRLLPLGDPPLLRVSPADTSEGFTLEELLASYRKASGHG
jgi:hypothetical protein